MIDNDDFRKFIEEQKQKENEIDNLFGEMLNDFRANLFKMREESTDLAQIAMIGLLHNIINGYAFIVSEKSNYEQKKKLIDQFYSLNMFIEEMLENFSDYDS